MRTAVDGEILSPNRTPLVDPLRFSASGLFNDSNTPSITGGIELTGAGANVAEELPVAKGSSVPGPAEVVGGRRGTVGLDTEEAGRTVLHC